MAARATMPMLRMFSPWRYDIDKAARVLLEDSGWREAPLDDLPTGGELVDRYLCPLAALPAIGHAPGAQGMSFKSTEYPQGL